MDRNEIALLLKENHASITPQRLEMAYMLVNKKQHLKAEEINQMLNRKFPKASRATIFNNLHLFVKIGLLKELEMKSGVTIYDSNVTNHHHFLDSETGEIKDIELTKMQESLLNEIFVGIGRDGEVPYQMEDLQVVVKGKQNF